MKFCRGGPIDPEIHYFIPPLSRMDLKLVLDLIDERNYFVLHAPRQTGKTTFLNSLCDELNRSGRYRSIYVNLEVGQTAREDVQEAMKSILGRLALAARVILDDYFIKDNFQEFLDTYSPHIVLGQILAEWASMSDKPLVLLIDEINTLVGDSFNSVLRQLRTGHPKRPKRFPQSVVLCGVGAVRDYRIQGHTTNEIITGGNVFNIVTESIRLSDFSLGETKSLLEQHTQETGQCWSDGTIEEVWRLSQGQPWLVNALADQACRKVSDLGQPIELSDIEDARNQLILRRDPHFDQLATRLKEQRVRRVIEPLVSDGSSMWDFSGNDLEYALELGLVTIDKEINIANPIYQEVIPRYLT